MTGGTGFRPEIQGLRAIAVLAVLVFHLWPAVLPGGYVGVDVFFVISGFLITGILLREVEATGRIDVPRFYARRIKRLLPAATVVILAVAVCLSLLPVTRWYDTASEIAASALYMENWWLAAQAVDYLAAENAPSPLQHYWSLSVEEQYYIVWPLLLAATAPLAALAWMSARRRFGLIVVTVGILSLAWSIYLTPRSPGMAYFATTTRAWELAIGGALAVFRSWERLPSGARIASGWIGFAMIVAATVSFDGQTVFPGYAALLPTAGAALMIVGGTPDHRGAVSTLLGLRPMQYVGDLSYSLYLWHWPVIIFYQSATGRSLGLVDGVAAAAISLALAHQTKYLVEDYFRRPEFAAGARWKPFAFAAVCIGLALLSWQSIRFQVGRLEAAATAQATVQGRHPGALSLSDGVPVPSAQPLPSPLVAKQDKGDPYRDRCIASLAGTNVKECVYGPERTGSQIVIVGDSHAVHWVPALQLIAEHSGARLTVITKSACAVVDISEQHANENYRACMEWSPRVVERLVEMRPDVVLFAHSKSSLSGIRGSREASAEVLAESFGRIWSVLEDNGATVFALRDTPSFPFDVPDCLNSAAPLDSCRTGTAKAVSRVDPLVLATQRHPSVKLIDLTAAICGGQYCEPIVGNVVAWRDAHHMTATFARTLAPALSRAMGHVVDPVPAEALLEDGGGSPGVAPEAADCAADLATCLAGVRPALAVVTKDIPPVYRQQGCHSSLGDDEVRLCRLGSEEAGTSVFVIGDSHAAQWFPVYEYLASRKGLKVRMTTKAACSFADVVVKGGRSGDGAYRSCTEWSGNALRAIVAERPDFVLMSQSNAYSVMGKDREGSFEDMVDGYVRRIGDVQRKAGARVIVLADTPRTGINPPDCLSRPGATLSGCTRSAAARRDPLVEAGRRVGLPVVDVNDLVCPDGSCPPVIGNVLVWRDTHHVTATFATEQAPVVSKRIVDAMR